MFHDYHVDNYRVWPTFADRRAHPTRHPEMTYVVWALLLLLVPQHASAGERAVYHTVRVSLSSTVQQYIRDCRRLSGYRHKSKQTSRVRHREQHMTGSTHGSKTARCMRYAEINTCRTFLPRTWGGVHLSMQHVCFACAEPRNNQASRNQPCLQKRMQSPTFTFMYNS